MKQYLETLKEILDEGTRIENDRSGTGTISLIGTSEKYPLENGDFPLITTRKVWLNKTILELIWFIKGDPDVTFLKEHKVPFWDKWTSKETNTIGPMYPLLWRKKPEVTSGNGMKSDEISAFDNIIYIDQIAALLNGLKEDINKNVFSRRHYLSNIALGLRPEEDLSPIDNVERGNMALDTCHQVFYVSLRPLIEKQKEASIQYQVEQNKAFGIEKEVKALDYGIESMLVMRSNDVMVGKPHNIAQYALLNIMIANALGVMPLSHRHTVHDSHVYLSHVEKAKELLDREPLPMPKLYVNPDLSTDRILSGNMSLEDFKLTGYQSHDPISFSLEG
nr:MAG TPA: Thymidylate synthase [Caudoviricetes sp.]